MWKKITSKINNYNIINKTDENNFKKYRVIKNYSYNIDNVTYSNIDVGKWVNENPDNKLKNSNGEQILDVYYNIKEPHISITKLRHNGISTILIGIILVCFGIYIYIDKCKVKGI